MTTSERVLNEDALEAARVAVEDTLIEMRDSGIGILGRGNGFVVNEYNGSPSSIMRLGTAEGLRIAITTYLDAAEDPDVPA